MKQSNEQRYFAEMLAALEAYERLDNYHANCDECDGLDQPEACANCFPLADDARLKTRQILARIRAKD